MRYQSLLHQECQADATKAVQATCDAKALDKNGKKLADTAKASFVKEYLTDSK